MIEKCFINEDQWVIDKYGDQPFYHAPKGYEITNNVKVMERKDFNDITGFNVPDNFGQYVLATICIKE